MNCGDATRYSILITNSSSKTVSYNYNDISDSLAPSDSKTYEVLAYTQPPKNIIDQNGIASLKMEHNRDSFIFNDAVPFNLNVANKLPIDVKIKADNYIDDNGLTEFTISANAEKTTAKIYTSTPKFTSQTNYPVIIEYNVNSDTVYVIIR